MTIVMIHELETLRVQKMPIYSSLKKGIVVSRFCGIKLQRKFIAHFDAAPGRFVTFFISPLGRVDSTPHQTWQPRRVACLSIFPTGSENDIESFHQFMCLATVSNQLHTLFPGKHKNTIWGNQEFPMQR